MGSIESVNFGKYLENVRLSHNISVYEVSDGICDHSLITKIESGERIANMMLRDRLVERCGATSEEYEKYVKVDEFKRWKQRRTVIADIENRKYTEAKKKIDEYRENAEDDPLEKQFCLDMKAMIAKLEGDSEAACWAEEALRKTVSIDSDGFVSGSRLAPKEINLAIEYSKKMDSLKRNEQLKRLLRYADENELDKRNLVMFYPKLVYTFVAETAAAHRDDPVWLAYAMELNDKASELLADTNRLIYMLELTEVRKQLWEYILSLNGCVKSIGYNKFLEEKNRTDEELALWNELGQTYGMDMYTNDWCYLYREEGVKCVGDVIRKRRKTIGMSMAELGDDICAVDSINSIERLDRNPQPQKMVKLLQRLGLSGEYQNTCITVSDADTKRIEEKIMQYSNSGNSDKALQEIEKLKRLRGIRKTTDKQFIVMLESVNRWRNKEISREDCLCKVEEALKYTLPHYCLSDEIYMTRLEMSCIYNMIMIMNGEVGREKADFIIHVCEAFQNDVTNQDIRVLELFYISAIKIYLNIEDDDNADKCVSLLIRLEIRNKRSALIYQGLNERLLVHSLKQKQGKLSVGESEQNEELIRLLKQYKASKQANKQVHPYDSDKIKYS